MLRLSGLDSDGMADETRDAFVNMAENLGIEADEAEDLVDLYLEEADKMSDPGALPPPRGDSRRAGGQTGAGSERGRGRTGSARVPRRTGPASRIMSIRLERPNALCSLRRICHGKRGARCRAERTAADQGDVEQILHVALPDHERRVRAVRSQPRAQTRAGRR